MILMETKFTNHAYFHNRLGYNVLCLPVITTEAGGAQGGVVLVVRDDSKGWSVQVMLFHGPNMVICEVFASGKRTPLIGAYLLLPTLENLPDLEEVLTRFREQYPIVLGDLISNIDQDHNPRSHQVADIMMDFGLVELLHQFRKG